MSLNRLVMCGTLLLKWYRTWSSLSWKQSIYVKTWMTTCLRSFEFQHNGWRGQSFRKYPFTCILGIRKINKESILRCTCIFLLPCWVFWRHSRFTSFLFWFILPIHCTFYSDSETVKGRYMLAILTISEIK